MDKRTLKKWIREAKEAEAQASETALARARNVAEIKVTVRKKETGIKIRLGAEVLRLARGEIAETVFRRIVAEAAREIDEINHVMTAAGLRRRSEAEKAANQNVASLASASVTASLDKATGIADVELGFARQPPENLRNALKGKFGFRYYPQYLMWRGKAVPELVVEEIRSSNSDGIVKILLADGKPYPLT